jgi:hypothetical protein
VDLAASWNRSSRRLDRAFWLPPEGSIDFTLPSPLITVSKEIYRVYLPGGAYDPETRDATVEDTKYSDARLRLFITDAFV